MTACAVVTIHEINVENSEQRAETENSQTGYTQTHHGTAVERYLESLGEAGTGGLRCAYVCFGSNAHAEETGEYGKERTYNESHHDQRVTGFNTCAQPAEECTCDHHINGEETVFSFQESHGAIGDIGSDALHLAVACILLGHPFLEKEHVNEADNPENR